jgi:alanyl-tRNA synthetase
MQQHTGQHVLSRAFIEVADLHTASFHMGEDACTIDLVGDEFNDKAAAEAEKLANSIVLEDRPVNIRNTSPDELESLDLRKAAPEGVTDVRLVEIDGFDLNPCCGTHVTRTGELGLIKVLKTENVKGTKRVQFKAGARALEDYRIKHEILQKLANKLTTSAGGIGAKVDKMSAELRQTQKRAKQLARNLAVLQVAEMLESAQDYGGVKLVVRHFAYGDADFLRQLSAALKSREGTVAVLGAGDGSVLCSASDGIDVDFSDSAVAMAVAAGGSGGGKGAFAQLRLPGGADVENFLQKVGDNVKTVL